MGRTPRAVLLAAVLAVALASVRSSGGATTPAQLVVSDVNGVAIALVDASAGTVGAPIPVAQFPTDVAVTADGRTAYVTGGYAGVVVPVDLETSTAGTAIPLSCASNIALVPGRQKAYVTQGCDSTVTPIDLSTNSAGNPITVGPSPWGVAVAPGGDTVYVTTGYGSTPDALVPIDVDSDLPGAPIPLGSDGDPADVAVTPDGATAFVAMERADTVVPVDLVTGTAGTPIAVSTNPAGLALTPDGTTLFVTHSQLRAPNGLGDPIPHDVTPIDVATRTALPQIVVGSQTSGVVVTADGTTAYVSLVYDADPTEGAIVPIDVATDTAGTPIPVPGEPVALSIRPDGSDSVAPTVRLHTTPQAPTGGAGWFNAQDLPGGSLSVTASAFDAISGVAETTCVVDGVSRSASGDRLVVQGLGDGVHTFSCTATDGAGNVTSPAVTATYRVDTTAPTLAPAVSGTGPGGSVLLNDPAAVARANADDGTGSGVASSSCGVPDVSSVGVHTISCAATDVAGNSRSAQGSYVVEYLLVGLSPADGTTARAGQPLRIGISLADASGAPAILCAGCSVQCQAFLVGGAGQNAGPYPMRYHNGSGEYRYSWKPSASGLGTTRIAVSVLYPGTAVATTVSALVTIT